MLAEGDEEPGSEDGTGGGEAIEDRKVGMSRRAFSDFPIEGFDGMQCRTELFGEDGDEERKGFDNALVLGERPSAFDSVYALCDESRLSDVVLVEEALEGRSARLASGFERRPLLKEVAEQVAVLVGKPL